jgi:ubiquinone/menaquinone biosynthesis C-methylase UbiE
LKNSEANKAYYNKVSGLYDKKHMIDMKDYPLFCRQIKYLMKPKTIKSGSSVLDCGCGTGRGALKFSMMRCNVTAVDISPEIVDICLHNAQKRGLPVKVGVEDCNKLSFDNEKFDYVTLSAALHHMENLTACIGEMYRVTKKGGALILIAEPKTSIIRPKYMRDKKEYLSGKYDREVIGAEMLKENPDVHIFKVKELEDILLTAGYSNIRTDCFYFLSSVYRDLLFFRIKNGKIREALLHFFSWIDTTLLFWLPNDCYALFNLIAWKE